MVIWSNSIFFWRTIVFDEDTAKKLLRMVVVGISSFCAFQHLVPCQEGKREIQKRRLEFYDVILGRPRVWTPRPPRWIGPGHAYLLRKNGKRVVVDAETGKEIPFKERFLKYLSGKRISRLSQGRKKTVSRLLKKLLGLGKKQGIPLPGKVVSWDQGRLAAFEVKNDLFIWDLGNGIWRLTHDPEPEVILKESPSHEFLLFKKKGNLWVVGKAGGKGGKGFYLKQLTREGSPERLLGRLDWVYQEEVYGRGNWDAYWFSQDGKWLAFLDLDVSKEPRVQIVDNTPVHQKCIYQRYPKAGDPNARCLLQVISLMKSTRTSLDPSKWVGAQGLIVRVDWGPGPKVYAQIQDREQRKLVLVALDPVTGKALELLREERKDGWIDRAPAPVFVEGSNTFLWMSQRTGYRHIYLYTETGRPVGSITRGNWKVKRILGVDKEGSWIYFTGTRETFLENHFYRVRIKNPGEPVLLTRKGFSHSISLSPDMKYFFDTWSNLSDPGGVDLKRTWDGKLVKEISRANKSPLKEFELGEVKMHRVPAKGGIYLYGISITPPGWDRKTRLPVLVNIYGGPNTPQVRNRWSVRANPWEHFLAGQGVMVWKCDPRSASGRGHKFSISCYRRLGRSELEDIESGIGYLVKTGWADPERIGIFGVSYGGYMVCYAMTHSRKFRCGISIAGVTDWRNYDSIYTERYMRMPRANAEGYRDSSAVAGGKDLFGELLLIHGTMDDNVHISNTIQLVEELVRRGKLNFRLMLYPREGHGVGRPVHRLHLKRLMWGFLRTHLLE